MNATNFTNNSDLAKITALELENKALKSQISRCKKFEELFSSVMHEMQAFRINNLKERLSEEK